MTILLTRIIPNSHYYPRQQLHKGQTSVLQADGGIRGMAGFGHNAFFGPVLHLPCKLAKCFATFSAWHFAAVAHHMQQLHCDLTKQGDWC
ncbi:hypothetical protein [Rheinheimera sp. 1928-s]|uniref:hypothetical protein n=1 Tax=Rheinheimera sp. 1928-s TaxID=3033803 RepID=UPI0026270C1B|nr:hypothetical protein [Rheinheimera sp. 1928-s]MDF3125348.1 hypothetical protein [Rheinheimera sp. 1928-s]